MKKLLFIALLMPLGLMAQKDTALICSPLSLSTTGISPESSRNFIVSSDTTLFSRVYKRDTIKVIMLVCDTSHVFDTIWKLVPDKRRNSITAHYKEFKIDKGYTNNRVYWVDGYLYTDNNTFYYKYLDADKKPFKEGIIVWLSTSMK